MTVPGAQRSSRMRAFIWVGLGQAIAALGAIVGVRLVTQAFPPTSYGESALLMTVATLALQVVLLPLGAGTLRFFASARENDQLSAFTRAFVRTFGWVSVGLVLLGALVAVVAACLGHGAILPGLAALISYSLAAGWCSAID